MTWLSSSKNKPCPVCARTKDADCVWAKDLQTIRCHTRANTSSTIAQPADRVGSYTFTGKIESNGVCDRAIYCLKDDWVKPIRQLSGKAAYYNYPNSAGSPLARVSRLDTATGKKFWQEYWNGTGWQKGLPDEVKAQIHLYRIDDPINQKAIARGLPLRIVEGEKTADALLAIGLAATTSIGGAGKWRHYGGAHGNYSADLDGAVLVLCPDRDRAGVEHCVDIASDYYSCKWLYAAPDSPSWRCYQIGTGYDAADWIDDLKASGLDADEVYNAISGATESSARNFEINFTETEEGKKPSVNMTGNSIADSQSSGTVSIIDTLAAVTDILGRAAADWQETNWLTELEAKSQIKGKAFWQMVAQKRMQIDDVLPEDVSRLEKLIDWSQSELNWSEVLPDLAPFLIHDAQTLGIDPVSIWQYLLPAVLSLAGKKAELDLGTHKIPSIAWTCTVAESGTGKTRAEKLVIEPLKKLQEQEHRRFKLDTEAYAIALKAGDDASKPEPEKKLLFQVATIQAVMCRLAEQGDNGTLWSRDEIAGLFKSLNQFSGGKDSEGLECLLDLWDGSSIQTDRVNAEDSYFIPSTRMSISGGIQPGIYRRIFKDPDDAQGMAARFLFAIPKEGTAKRSRGKQLLPMILPPLYQSIADADFGEIRPTDAAADLYDDAYEYYGNEARKCQHAGIRAWLRKLSAQVGRIALGLHIIECAFNETKRADVLTAETMERAIAFANYYRASFEWLQENAAESADISSILTRIWDKGLTENGITPRDAYRANRALSEKAKEMNRTAAAYTIDLFTRLVELGRGRIERNGRHIRFYSIPATNTKNVATVCHEAETIDQGEPQLSPVLLPVMLTNQNNGNGNGKPKGFQASAKASKPDPQAAIAQLLAARRNPVPVAVAVPAETPGGYGF